MQQGGGTKMEREHRRQKQPGGRETGQRDREGESDRREPGREEKAEGRGRPSAMFISLLPSLLAPSRPVAPDLVPLHLSLPLPSFTLHFPSLPPCAGLSSHPASAFPGLGVPGAGAAGRTWGSAGYGAGTPVHQGRVETCVFPAPSLLQFLSPVPPPPKHPSDPSP